MELKISGNPIILLLKSIQLDGINYLCFDNLNILFLNGYSFKSAYSESKISEGGAIEQHKEPSYTTWKIREDGEHIQTLDYIFYHSPDSFMFGQDDITAEEDTNEDNINYNELQDESQFTSQSHCSNIKVEKVLEFPTGEQISSDRVPSLAYASDHFSLIADFKIKSSVSELEE